jgi:energy-coupling factor transporter ATP-binding protein EcfA2
MKWITEIQLNNCRAFVKSETIEIPKDHHLLIYGENGSGKSSIYNGLKDFFSSSFPDSLTHFKLNYFEKAKKNERGSIVVKIVSTDTNGNDTETSLQFAEPDLSSNHRQREIILANKIKGFLDYKRMLKVHSLDVPDGEQPNVFNLVIKELLSEHRIDDPKGGVTSVELLGEYKRIAQDLLNNKSGSTKFENANDELLKLQLSVKTLLESVINKTNIYLDKYFKNKLIVSLNMGGFRVIKSPLSKKKEMVEKLSLAVKYAGDDIEFYQAFLNEARLSSLAICLYLASIKIFKPEPDNLKILYLDDVFIGLDTSNRFPLLEIIRDEFIKDGYQVFISTYDREWFELSRHWFNTHKISNKCLELFIEDDGNPNTPDYPVVIPHKGHFEKAEAYYKFKDYPSAGNYLRKECEEIIKNILPNTYKIDTSGMPLKELNKLIEQLNKFYEDCEIMKPTELVDAIDIYRKVLLNPSSHSDSKSSFFKREITDVFEVVKKLKMLSPITWSPLFGRGTKCTYQNIANNYSAEIELADNLFKVEYNGANSFSKHFFYFKTWTWNGIPYAVTRLGQIMDETTRNSFCKEKKTLKVIFEFINQTTGIAIPPSPNEVIKIGASGTLSDLLI